MPSSISSVTNIGRVVARAVDRRSVDVDVGVEGRSGTKVSSPSALFDDDEERRTVSAKRARISGS